MLEMNVSLNTYQLTKAKYIAATGMFTVDCVYVVYVCGVCMRLKS